MAQRSRRSAPPSVPAAPHRSPAQLAQVRDRVRELIEPLLGKAGYDLEDLAVRQVGRRHQLRVTVDGDGGASLDTIADLSRLVADALDGAEEAGEEIIPGEYQLEVSSPGVDRPLTLPRHWHRAVGRLVAVKVHATGAPAQPQEPGQKSKRSADRQLTGRVLAADETSVTLEIAEKKSVKSQTFALEQLGPGRVQIEFNRLDEISDDDLEEIADDEPDDADSDAGTGADVDDEAEVEEQ